MADTAVLSVHDALAAAISQGANPPLGPGPGNTQVQILGSPRFYLGKAPSTAPLGYYLFGAVSETDQGFYAQPGATGTYRIHCWADSSSNASRLYQWLKRLISGQILVLDGHTMVRGLLSRVTDASDADSTAWQVIADYHVESLEA